jgi:hypothetical protein
MGAFTVIPCILVGGGITAPRRREKATGNNIILGTFSRPLTIDTEDLHILPAYTVTRR